MKPEEDSSLKVTGLHGLEQLIRWNMVGREYCARCNKIHNVNNEEDVKEGLESEHKKVQKRFQCNVKSVTRSVKSEKGITKGVMKSVR